MKIRMLATVLRIDPVLLPYRCGRDVEDRVDRGRDERLDHRPNAIVRFRVASGVDEHLNVE